MIQLSIPSGELLLNMQVVNMSSASYETQYFNLTNAAQTLQLAQVALTSNLEVISLYYYA